MSANLWSGHNVESVRYKFRFGNGRPPFHTTVTMSGSARRLSETGNCRKTGSAVHGSWPHQPVVGFGGTWLIMILEIIAEKRVLSVRQLLKTQIIYWCSMLLECRNFWQFFCSFKAAASSSRT